jgi:hypothetical protein
MVLSTASMMGKVSEKKMGKYQCVRGVVTNQGIAKVGDIVELSDYEAKQLAAKFVPVADVMPVKVDPEEIRVAEALAVEHRDPVAPRRGRPPKGAK